MDIEDILNKIKKINNQETLPLYGLRRNSYYYNLISYINNSFCLFLGGSFDDAVLFIKRADEEKRLLIDRDIQHKDYFAACDEYMGCVSKYVLEHNLLTEVGLGYLPMKYKM